jgi:hypothetical protein
MVKLLCPRRRVEPWQAFLAFSIVVAAAFLCVPRGSGWAAVIYIGLGVAGRTAAGNGRS